MLLGVFMYMILRVLPSKMSHQGKLTMAIFGTDVSPVVALYLGLFILTSAIVWFWGARAQDRRYRRREFEFNKVFSYFNKRNFKSLGIKFESGKYGAFIIIRLQRDFKKPNPANSVELRTSMLGAPPVHTLELPRDDPSPSMAFTTDSKLQQDFILRRASIDSEELPNPLLAQRIKNIIDDDEEEEADILTETKNSMQTNKFKNTVDYINEEMQKMSLQQTGVLAPLLPREDSSGPRQEGSVPQEVFRRMIAIEEEPQEEEEEFKSAKEDLEEEELFTVLEGPVSVVPRQPPPADARSSVDDYEFKSALDFNTVYNHSRMDE